MYSTGSIQLFLFSRLHVRSPLCANVIPALVGVVHLGCGGHGGAPWEWWPSRTAAVADLDTLLGSGGRR